MKRYYLILVWFAALTASAGGATLTVDAGGRIVHSGNGTISLGSAGATGANDLVLRDSDGAGAGRAGGRLDLSTATSSVELAGHWTELVESTLSANAASVVTFFGGGLQTITLTNGGKTFGSVTIRNNAAAPSTTAMVEVRQIAGQVQDMVITGDLSITDGWFGVAGLGSQTEEIRIVGNKAGGSTVTVGDTTTDAANEEVLYLAASSAAGASLDMLSGGTLLGTEGSAEGTYNGGRIELAGRSAAARAGVIRSAGSGFVFRAFGSFRASWWALQSADADGVLFGRRSRVEDLNGGSFSGVPAAGVYVSFWKSGNPSGGNLDGADRAAVPVTVDGCAFAAGGAGAMNVRSGGSTPLVMFSDPTGALAGEAFDDDGWDRITWADAPAASTGGLVLNVNTGVRYGSLQAAVSAAGAGHVLRPLYNKVFSESNVNMPNLAPDIVLERFVFWPTTGRAINNTAVTGVVRNCVFLKGDAGYRAIANVETIDHCTFMPVVDTDPAVTAIGFTVMRNTVMKGATTDTTDVVNKVVEVAAADIDTYFRDNNNMDLHLKSGAALCLNTGMDNGILDDWEGNARPAGAGTKDIGADEYYAAAVPTAVYRPMMSGNWTGRVMWTIPNLSRSTKGFYSLVGGGAQTAAQDYTLVLWSQTGTMIQSLSLGGEPTYALMMPDGGGDFKIILVLDLGNSGGPGTTDGDGDSVAIIHDDDENGAAPLSFDAAFTSGGPAGPSGVGASWVRNDVVGVGRRWYGPGPIRRFNLLNAGGKRWGYVVSLAADDDGGGANPTQEWFFKLDPMPAGGDPLAGEVAGGIPWNERSGIMYLRSGGKLMAGRNTLNSELNRVNASTMASEAATTNTAGGVNDLGSMTSSVMAWPAEMYVLPKNNILYRRMSGTMGDPASGWTQSQDIGSQKNSFPYPPVGVSWLWGGAVGRVYKIDLDGSQATADVVNGAAESGEEGDDWPVTFDGSVSTEMGWFNSQLMWGTSAGECWIVSALSERPAVPGNDGMNGVISGFPYRIPQRQINSRHYNFQSVPKKVLFSTNWGEVYEFNVP